MQLVDKIDTRERVEKLTEERRDDFFVRMITGKDVTEDVETSKGVFTLKYPKAKDLLSIGRIAAFRRDFKPVDGYDAGTEMLNIMAATLDVMVVSGPRWFEDAKKQIQTFLFWRRRAVSSSRNFTVKRIRFERTLSAALIREKGRTISEYLPQGDDDPMGGGAFGSLANEPDDTKP